MRALIDWVVTLLALLIIRSPNAVVAPIFPFKKILDPPGLRVRLAGPFTLFPKVIGLAVVVRVVLPVIAAGPLKLIVLLLVMLLFKATGAVRVVWLKAPDALTVPLTVKVPELVITTGPLFVVVRRPLRVTLLV